VPLDRVEQRDGLEAVARRPRAGLLDDPSAVDRLLHGRDEELGAQLGREAVAVRDHLVEVVPRVDVHEGERHRRGAERLTREMCEHDRVLAAAEQHDGALELGGDLADDVDGLRLQRLQVRDRDA
jgi:hypothetical protein